METGKNAHYWTLWNAPSSGLAESPNIWYKFDIVNNGAIATSYIVVPTNNLGTFGALEPFLANNLPITNNGNYLGIVGDAFGGAYISYWNGMIIRSLPPVGVNPSVSFGALR